MPSVSAYRTPAFRHLPQQYPRGVAAARPPLAHFVVLSMLLHALFIVLFGAPSGGSREGRAMWGSLSVLLEPLSAPGPSLRLDRGVAAEHPGLAATKRPPGARDSTPKPPRPAVVPVAPAPLELSATKQIIPPVTSVAPPAPPPEPRVEPLPVQPLFAPLRPLDRTVTPELKTEILPSVKTPPAEVPVPPAPTPPPAAPPPLERPMAPRVEQPPAEAPAIAAPLVQPTAAEQTPTPPVERAPVEVPAVPVPKIERIEPPKIERSSSPPDSASPREQQALPQPPAIERAEPRLPERELPVKVEPAPRAPPVASPERAMDIFGAPRDAPPAAPDAGAGPRIDLDAARKRARELAREGSGNRAILPFPMPPPPERKTKEQIAIEKARKPDCRTAYQDMGLLAVVPLVANEFGEGNCRW